MTKKRSTEFLGEKMQIFFSEKNVIQKFWSVKNFPPKLGAKSPPLALHKYLNIIQYRNIETFAGAS